MPRVPYVCHSDQQAICASLAEIRRELEIAEAFPEPVLIEARERAEAGPMIPPGSAATTVADRTEIPFVTIDPPGSKDLDQAYAGERTDHGWRIHYAIADVAAWVPVEGAIDREARARGLTMYFPDGRAPLHPAELSEGAASLLPNQERQSLLWTIDLDDGGNLLGATLERARVRSRAQLTYREAAEGIAEGESAVLRSLEEIGRRRQALEIERGAVSLNLAQQEVVVRDGAYALVYDESLPVEEWNAQISLLTGIAAAQIMLEGGVGMLRTLPPPSRRTIRELRLTARALDIDWPEDATYAEIVRALDPSDPDEAALIAQSARGLRGAGYAAFDGPPPEQTEHSAIAAEYAHVTAPLRRLGDRFVNEVVLALVAGKRPPDWVLEALPELPRQLGQARNREGALDRAIVDLIEAALLEDHVGQAFTGVVTDVDERRPRARIQLRHPAVGAVADGHAELGDEVVVRLLEADVAERRVRFELLA